MSMTLADNNYASRQIKLDDPAWDGEQVTPGTPFAKGPCKRLFVGSGGNLSVRMVGGTVLPFLNVANGTALEVMATEVLTSGTTADNILALY